MLFQQRTVYKVKEVKSVIVQQTGVWNLVWDGSTLNYFGYFFLLGLCFWFFIAVVYNYTGRLTHTYIFLICMHLFTSKIIVGMTF